jgi:hypothetical protein
LTVTKRRSRDLEVPGGCHHRLTSRICRCGPRQPGLGRLANGRPCPRRTRMSCRARRMARY